MFTSAQELDVTVLEGIMVTSNRNNLSRSITGALYYDPTSSEILHVLEGPTLEVVRLYLTIQKDTRHNGCTVLTSEHLSFRLHGDFPMHLIMTDGQVLEAYMRNESLAVKLCKSIQPCLEDQNRPPLNEYMLDYQLRSTIEWAARRGL